jgi:DUF4097 and DUF4098 domain-containing protein YvlB
MKKVFIYSMRNLKEVELRAKITFIALLALCVSMAFSFDTVKNLRLSADGIEKLEIDCGAGYLHLSGDESLESIEVEAEIIVKGKSERDTEKYIEENVKLELKKRGSRAVLISKFDKGRFWDNFRTRVINLKVRIPKNMVLHIDDGSGEMKIEQIIGRVEIDDGSGEIHISGIQGDVSIDDGSGTIEVSDVFGNLYVDDGSGTIEVRDVDQNVRVNDGSGSIHIDGVGGDVIIEDDGSGSLKIKNVKGKVIK